MSGTTPARGPSGPAAPRKHLGYYELFERVAVGAMAEIYLGRARGEEGFEKMVAIKRILPRLAEDSRFVQMLQIEARIHASLSHKNIVQIHDLGVSSEGEYFIVLEFVDGRDLGALLDSTAKNAKAGASKRIDDAVCLFIMSELAEGVHFAHGLRGSDGNPLGLVHRDISPSNVLISYAGEVKLSDFGVAKRQADQSVVTSVKGELAYISPEQARGAPADRRSDIFSLGAVAFELFTGEPPRELDNTPDDYIKAASGILASPLRYRPDLPAAMERLLTGALAPDPRDRFPDARAFVDACREALATVPRPPSGEAQELRSLLAAMLPPGTRTARKLPSKVISLMPSLWEDVTVPDGTMTPTGGVAGANSNAAVPAEQVPAGEVPAKSYPVEPVLIAPGNITGEIPPLPQPESPRPLFRDSPLPTADRRNSLRGLPKRSWRAQVAIGLGLLVGLGLAATHFYVIPLPVAAVYFRPARLVVTSEPRAAEIFIDGKKAIGTTPVVMDISRDRLEHLVEVRKVGFEPANYRLRYDREVSLQVSIPLVPTRDNPSP